MRGSAFLAIWHDIEPHRGREFDDWHTREHMPERVGIPGFEVGRRFVDRGRDRHRYFTLYETRTLAVLGSDAYRARLDSPTEWTRRVQPTFTNFVRAPCRTLVGVGRGAGGSLATIRIALGERADARLEAACADLAREALSLHGVTAVHAGLAEPALARVATAESALRAPQDDEVVDAAVLIEGIGRRELTEALPAIERSLAPALPGAATTFAVYDLAYALGTEDL